LHKTVEIASSSELSTHMRMEPDFRTTRSPMLNFAT